MFCANDKCDNDTKKKMFTIEMDDQQKKIKMCDTTKMDVIIKRFSVFMYGTRSDVQNWN